MDPEHRSTQNYAFTALTSTTPNDDKSDTNRGIPLFNTSLQRILAHVNRWGEYPLQKKSLLDIHEGCPAIIEYDDITYDSQGVHDTAMNWYTTTGSSRDLHQHVSEEVYKVNSGKPRDILEAALNQRNDYEPTSKYHRVVNSHEVVPFNLDRQLQDPVVYAEITSKITEFLHDINADNREYQDQQAEWRNRLVRSRARRSLESP
jgi:hypothetical protein